MPILSPVPTRVVDYSVAASLLINATYKKLDLSQVSENQYVCIEIMHIDNVYHLFPSYLGGWLVLTQSSNTHYILNTNGSRNINTMSTTSTTYLPTKASYWGHVFDSVDL